MEKPRTSITPSPGFAFRFGVGEGEGEGTMATPSTMLTGFLSGRELFFGGVISNEATRAVLVQKSRARAMLNTTCGRIVFLLDIFDIVPDKAGKVNAAFCGRTVFRKPIYC
jgi:hypothetical protein